LLDPISVTVAGNTEENLSAWKNRGCSTVSKNNAKLFQEVDVILWAVKPQMFPKATESVVEYFRENAGKVITAQLHISVMAGITLQEFTYRVDIEIRDPTGRQSPLARTIRTMPTIGHRVGAGCTAFTLGPRAIKEDSEYVHALFSPTGMCMELPESQINAVGSVAGSGIGFMFPIMEALSDGAVKVGLSRELGLKMAAQAMKGAAELFLQEGKHPGALKDSVCSPGGTTIRGIAELERSGVRSGVINAVDAAYSRYEELGKLSN